MSAELIASFGRTVTVTRMAVGEYIRGVWQQGGNAKHVVVASVQPMSAQDLMLLPEGDRTTERIKLYSTFAFRTQGTWNGQQFSQDRVSVDGKVYSVVAVENYIMPKTMNIAFYKAEATIENENTNDLPRS